MSFLKEGMSSKQMLLFMCKEDLKVFTVLSELPKSEEIANDSKCAPALSVCEQFCGLSVQKPLNPQGQLSVTRQGTCFITLETIFPRLQTIFVHCLQYTPTSADC